MTTDRYPADLIVTMHDFSDCGWKAVLNSATREGYSSMWHAFSSAARQAIEDGRKAHGKVLWLLADACSMILSPKSINTPFKPYMVMENRRSAIPDDLNEADIIFFSQFVDQIDDPWLKARLADLVWLLQRKLGPKFALDAIDAYTDIPLDTEDGRRCWERAIRLSLMLGKGAGDRLRSIEAAITAAFDASTKEDDFLALRLSNLLAEYGLGRDKSEHIATKLESFAHQFNVEGDLHRARTLFDAAKHWFQKGGNTVKAAETTMAMAEGWVKEAIAQMSSEHPSHMIAASFYEKAIQVYRTIPLRKRAMHKVDERIAELHRQMSAAGEKSLDEMGMVSTPGVDIAELIENARLAVSGKPTVDALLSFANIYQGARLSEIRASAEKRLRQGVFRHFFTSTHLSRDGRVIAKQPATGLHEGTSEDNDPALWAQMIQDYLILLNIVVQGEILPAHKVLLQEHHFQESDFVFLAQQSPIVPAGRETLIGKALFAGYERDLVTALHVLLPQIEHMARTRLKLRGVKTTNLDNEASKTGTA